MTKIDPAQTDLTLGHRTRLPDALRILLTEYPRAQWEADPAFSGLIRFWLDRHLMFRQLLERMTAETDRFLDRQSDPETYGRALSRFGGMFVNDLHMHHQIEDHHYFPVLQGHDSRISAGFALLDKDHHALDDWLSRFAEGANGVLRTVQDREAMQDATGAFSATLGDVERLIDRHLTDEEELVVPVLLKYGEAGLPG